MFAKMAYELNNYKQISQFSTVDNISSELLYYEMCYYYNDSIEAYNNLINLHNNLIERDDDHFYINRVNKLIETIKTNKNKIKKII